MAGVPCSCQQLQRFLQQLHERVQVVESAVTTVGSEVETKAKTADFTAFRDSVEVRLSALESTAHRIEQALQLPDDMLRCGRCGKLVLGLRGAGVDRFKITVRVCRGKTLARPTIAEYLRHHDATIADVRAGLDVFARKDAVAPEFAAIRREAAERTDKVRMFARRSRFFCHDMRAFADLL